VPGLLGVGCTVANLPLSKPQLGHQSDDVDGDNFNMDTDVVISRFGICSRLKKKALRILTCLKLTSVKDWPKRTSWTLGLQEVCPYPSLILFT